MAIGPAELLFLAVPMLLLIGAVLLVVWLVRRSSKSSPASPMPPGWYPDPGGADMMRFWDGRGWTPHTEQGRRQPHP